MSNTAALFTPLKVGSKTMGNRISMSAMTRNRAIGTVPNDLMVEYYHQRAAGGAALIATEGILITRQGSEWPWAPGIWNEDHIKSWKKITDQVHTDGAIIYAQLWHLGRISHPDAEEQKLAGVPVYAPSPIAARGGKFRYIPGSPGYVTPTEIDDPWKLIALYKQAAINSKEAGFDGVELHGANGYLVHQFLDSTSNHRTDQWGGSVENRSRFGLEVLKVLKEVYGEDVSLKVIPVGGYNDMGMPLPETLETYKYFLSEADKLGLSYIAIVRYVAAYDVQIEGKLRTIPHDVVEHYRSSIKNSKVFLNGAVQPEEAAQLISAGKIDAAVIGVNWLLHPDLTKRIEHSKLLDNVFDPKNIYGNPNNDPEIGYTTYPTATY